MKAGLKSLLGHLVDDLINAEFAVNPLHTDHHEIGVDLNFIATFIGRKNEITDEVNALGTVVFIDPLGNLVQPT